MINSLKFLTLVALLSIFACNNDKEEQQKLQKVVIDKHDVLMAKMDSLTENQLRLDSITLKYKKIKVENPNLDSNTLIAQIDSAKNLLSNADEAMMNWMQQFNPDYTGKSSTEIFDYLRKQEQKIDSVKTLFDKSLAHSNALIQQYK
ncbi:hypothetical protein [Pedobacter glucosidilyticus]|uniref:hypothetical protein n=1 Tax=Pedobacter glucosidilyticus TaxID=1122941 RepID=UPI000401D7D7|nr:hypothetical protein [Pedobacter glucosidilyticus]